MEVSQSVALTLPIFLTDSTDPNVGKAGVSLTVKLKKYGDSSFSTISPTVTEIQYGWYDVALTATHLDTIGPAALHITASGANDYPERLDVISTLSLTTNGATNLATLFNNGAASSTLTLANVAAIKTKTDNLPTDPASTTNVNALSIPTAATIADAVWDEVRSGHTTTGTFGQGVASVQGNVTGNVAGSVASVTAVVSANVTEINNVTLTGDGVTTPVGAA